MLEEWQRHFASRDLPSDEELATFEAEQDRLREAERIRNVERSLRTSPGHKKVQAKRRAKRQQSRASQRKNR